MNLLSSNKLKKLHNYKGLLNQNRDKYLLIAISSNNSITMTGRFTKRVLIKNKLLRLFFKDNNLNYSLFGGSFSLFEFEDYSNLVSFIRSNNVFSGFLLVNGLLIDISLNKNSLLNPSFLTICNIPLLHLRYFSLVVRLFSLLPISKK